MREINSIVIHCSDTPASMDIGVAEIRDWHVNGNGWSDIGYHHVIRRDGTVQLGRPLGTAGAHVRGHNDNSLGVCLVGGHDGRFDFTGPQIVKVLALVANLLDLFPGATVVGHRDLDPRKACPGFDVQELFGF